MNYTGPGLSQIFITASLLLHAIAHTIALIALIGQTATGQSRRKIVVTSWLISTAQPRKASMILLPFWILSTLLFFGATASSWGVIIAQELWASISFAGAVVSTLGVIAVGANWPGSPSKQRAYLNSAVAMVMNLLILTAMVWLQWLPTRWIIA